MDIIRFISVMCYCLVQLSFITCVYFGDAHLWLSVSSLISHCDFHCAVCTSLLVEHIGVRPVMPHWRLKMWDSFAITFQNLEPSV